jgi:hypothetical protein
MPASTNGTIPLLPLRDIREGIRFWRLSNVIFATLQTVASGKPDAG